MISDPSAPPPTGDESKKTTVCATVKNGNVSVSLSDRGAILVTPVAAAALAIQISDAITTIVGAEHARAVFEHASAWLRGGSR